MARLTDRVYQVSGESTPSQKLPEKYEPHNQPNSPLATPNRLAVDYAAAPGRRSAVVLSAPRMNGMRYLYGRGMTHMPLQKGAANAIQRPYISGAQPNLQGPIHDAGFNDALYQAGYPGFNLGLSFKVPTLPQNTQGQPIGMSRNINISQKLLKLRRAGGAPQR